MLKRPAEAVAHVPAEEPTGVGVGRLPPDLRVTAEGEGGGQAGTALGLDQGDGIIEIAGEEIDLLPSGAPVGVEVGLAAFARRGVE